MCVVDGLKVLTDEEEKELRKKLIENKKKECEQYNGEPEMSMEEIIEEIYAFRREEMEKV